MFKGTILLVADRPLEGQILANFLESVGYELVSADSANTNATGQPKVDAALLVLDRADADLIDAVEQVYRLQRGRSLPIVAVFGDEPTIDLPIRMHVVMRPIRLFELVDEIERALSHDQFMATSVLSKSMSHAEPSE